MNVITELRGAPYHATLKELSEIAGVSASCISQWEKKDIPPYGYHPLKTYRNTLRILRERATRHHLKQDSHEPTITYKELIGILTRAAALSPSKQAKTILESVISSLQELRRLRLGE